MWLLGSHRISRWLARWAAGWVMAPLCLPSLALAADPPPPWKAAWADWSDTAYGRVVLSELPALDDVGAPILRDLVQGTSRLVVTERDVPAFSSAVDVRRAALALRAAHLLAERHDGGLAAHEQVMRLTWALHHVLSGADGGHFLQWVSEEAGGAGRTDSATAIGALTSADGGLLDRTAALFEAHRDFVLAAVPNRVEALLLSARFALDRHEVDGALQYARKALARRSTPGIRLVEATALALSAAHDGKAQSDVETGNRALVDLAGELPGWDDRSTRALDVAASIRAVRRAGSPDKSSSLPLTTLATAARDQLAIGSVEAAARWLAPAAGRLERASSEQLDAYLLALAYPIPVAGPLPARLGASIGPRGHAAWLLLQLYSDTSEWAAMPPAQRDERMSRAWPRIATVVEACGAPCSLFLAETGPLALRAWVEQQALLRGDEAAAARLESAASQLAAWPASPLLPAGGSLQRSALAWKWLAGSRVAAVAEAWKAAEPPALTENTVPAEPSEPAAPHHRNAAGLLAAQLALATDLELGVRGADFHRAQAELDRLSSLPAGPPCPEGGCFDAQLVRALRLAIQWLQLAEAGADEGLGARDATQQWLASYPEWRDRPWAADMRTAGLLAMVFESMGRSGGADDAHAFADAARSFDPRSPGAAYAEGLLELADGEQSVARAHLQRAVRFESSAAGSLLAHLASARLAKSERDPSAFGLHLGAARTLWDPASAGLRQAEWRAVVSRPAASAWLRMRPDGALEFEADVRASWELWQPIRGLDKEQIEAIWQRFRGPRDDSE